MRYYLSFLCLISVTSFGSIRTAATFTDPSKSIIVSSASPTATIHLQDNATTGYGWFWLRSEKNECVSLQSYRYIAPDRKLIGAPGSVEFVFNIAPKCFKAPEILSVPLVYARSWELAASPVAPTRFTIIAEPK